MLGLVNGPAFAQELGVPQASILTISPDRVFAQSLFGKRVQSEIDSASRELAAENRRIEAELVEEEKALTEERADMDPVAFRVKANAFDEKAQRIRREQNAKVVELNARTEDARLVFLGAVRPVLQQVMLETGASVILDRSSVFLSANATDVTDIVITRIDAAIGDGAELEQAEE